MVFQGVSITCMQRKGKGELEPFDPKIEQVDFGEREKGVETHNRYLVNMAENIQQNPNLRDENELPGGNGNRGNNNIRWPVVQLNDPDMLLEEFILPPTVIQSITCRPSIQANNFELKVVTLQLLQGIQFHGLLSEDPNTHLTSFLEVCDNVKYNGVAE